MVVDPAELELRYWIMMPFLVTISIDRLSQTISFGLIVTLSNDWLGWLMLRPDIGNDGDPHAPFPLPEAPESPDEPSFMS